MIFVPQMAAELGFSSRRFDKIACPHVPRHRSSLADLLTKWEIGANRCWSRPFAPVLGPEAAAVPVVGNMAAATHIPAAEQVAAHIPAAEKPEQASGNPDQAGNSNHPEQAGNNPERWRIVRELGQRQSRPSQQSVHFAYAF